jgi:GAF domain-containing protein
VEPVPETAEALAALGMVGDTHTAATLAGMGLAVLAIVPECVGLSLALIEDGLTFTLVASRAEIAGLDAMQYLDGGPCVTAADDGVTIDLNVADAEARWQAFARASAAAGIASSLSLPILRNGRLGASVNLYASAPDAFQGHHEELAQALGAWATGAVSNADLSFSTRLEAAQAPDRLASTAAINQAIGVLVETRGWTTAEAAERLGRAAAQAGITQTQVALALLGLHEPP